MIKSRVGNVVEEKTRDYPYIGKYRNELSNSYYVLFIKSRTGVLISTSERDPLEPVGKFSQNWIEYDYEPTHDEIILKNG